MSGVPKEPEAGEHGHRAVERRRKLRCGFFKLPETPRGPIPFFEMRLRLGEEVTYPRLLAE